VPVARLPFTYVVKGQYWRFRRGGVDTALPGAPGDPAFHARYAELVALAAPRAGPSSGSMAALVAAYRASAEYRALRGPTQLDYSRTLDLIVTELGDQPYRYVTAPMVKAVRDDFAATPRKAHKLKQMVSRLYTWAAEEGRVPPGTNPAAEFRRLRVRAKTITPWSEEEIALFLAHAPARLRLAVLLMVCTGQRAEDVATMEWTAWQGGFIRVRQSKTGEAVEIACHPELRTALDAIHVRRGRILRGAKGGPWTANAMRKAVEDQCAAIEAMPRRSCHGLRYAAAGRMEAAGCTVAQISAVLGHRTYAMAMKYLTARRESEAGMARIMDANRG
jgi:integrase